MFFFLLKALKAPNQLFLLKLQLLGFALILVDELLLVIDFFTTFLSSLSHLLVSELLYLASAFRNHLLDRLTLDMQIFLVLRVMLHFSHLILFELVFDGLSTLKFRNVHVVASVLNILTTLLLALEGLETLSSLLILFLRRFHLLLQQSK